MNYKHTPVMLREVLGYLDPQLGQYFIDCTLGGGGYTFPIAEKVGKGGKVLAIDLDKSAIKNAKFKNQKSKLNNIILAYDNFKNLQKIVQKNFKEKEIKFHGVVFDLGLSSAQLESPSRGFSFQLDAPLDMALSQETRNKKQETKYIVNNYNQKDLEGIIKKYGGERFAGRIARKIVECRKKKPIKTTGQLVEMIASAVPASYKRKRIHFATRTFQALRIATNKELENLEKALPQTLDLLDRRGRLVIISYHSLEDRIVKQFFKRESKDCLCPLDLPVCRCSHKAKLKILTRKVLIPTEEEVENNPRARSAKMRVAERI
jgi:16S rRNA (cytosine1402-N4)-methyltransferase